MRIVWYLVRELVEVAVARPLLPAAGPVPEGPSHLRQLLLAVAQVADVDDGHLVEGQHGPLLDAAQDDGVQLGVVVQQGAVHLQAQQVGGEVDVLDAGGELAGLRRQNLGGLPRPKHLPPVEVTSSVSAGSTQTSPAVIDKPHNVHRPEPPGNFLWHNSNSNNLVVMSQLKNLMIR